MRKANNKLGIQLLQIYYDDSVLSHNERKIFILLPRNVVKMISTLSNMWEIYKIVGIKGLWLESNRFILEPDARADFARNHIRYLSDIEGIRAAEIGVWKGEHAEVLQKQLDIELLYLVDPYDAYEEYEEKKSHMERMKEAERQAGKRLSKYDNIKWIKDRSTVAARQISGPLDYVYIDGNHKFQYVKEDIENYYKIVRKGGVVAGHDINWPGVAQAVSEFAEEKNIEFNTEKRGTDWYIIK